MGRVAVRNTHRTPGRTITALIDLRSRNWADLELDSRQQRTCSLMFGGIGVLRNQKASTTLEILDLGGNNVGDVGAHAIAEALKAGVLTCCRDS